MLAPLKKHRLLAGLSQQEIADKIGVSQSTYYRWECGDTPIPAAKIKKLAKLFETSVDVLEGRPQEFDYLGYNRAMPDDRRYFGEVAVHFANGGEALLLSISIAERDDLSEQLHRCADFLKVSTLDNWTVIIRSAAISDVFFSSEAYDDFGPEHDTYKGALGIHPNADFWEVVENSECPEALEGYLPEKISSVLEIISLSDGMLDELVRQGKIPSDERTKVRQEADELAQEFHARATELSWQLSIGKRRSVYLDEDSAIYSVLESAAMSDAEGVDMLYIPAEGYHRSIHVNLSAIDFIAGPSHRYERGLLAERMVQDKESKK